jgi:hypothetical protein
VKSSAPTRVAYLEAQFPELNPAMRDVAASTEDAFDAAVSAIVMSRHEHELLALPTCDDARTRREGRVWLPGQAASASWSRPSEASMSGCRMSVSGAELVK